MSLLYLMLHVALPAKYLQLFICSNTIRCVSLKCPVLFSDSAVRTVLLRTVLLIMILLQVVTICVNAVGDLWLQAPPITVPSVLQVCCETVTTTKHESPLVLCSRTIHCVSATSILRNSVYACWLALLDSRCSQQFCPDLSIYLCLSADFCHSSSQKQVAAAQPYWLPLGVAYLQIAYGQTVGIRNVSLSGLCRCH